MKHGSASVVLAVGFLFGDPSAASERVVGGPCDGCENVFVGVPESLASRSRIAPADTPGDPLQIEGTVTSQDGEVQEGIIVYAYHTDSNGVYPRDETRHGGLRGWAQTDARGRYRFDTIRPGAYPGRTTPQHVHMHIVEPGKCTYYIDSIVFDDDPLLTARHRKQYAGGRGGNGIVHPERDADGVWHVRRDITLGKGIPGYKPE